MIIIGASLMANPGREQELESALLAMLPPVSQEPGAVEYRLNRALDNPRRFFFYEKYTDQAAVDHHMGTAHFQALGPRIQGLLAAPPEIVFYEEIGSIRG